MSQIDQKPSEVSIATNATVLTIAGSDPSGGAGLQADLKTFQQLGCYGMSVVTLLTIQNTQGVDRVEVMSADLIEQQIDAVLSDIPPRVIKVGALGDAETVRCVARKLRGVGTPLVVDPVLVSKHGHRLASEDCVQAYRDELLPMTTVFTPNRFEAAALLDCKLESLQDTAEAAAKLQSLGARFVALKAGDFDGDRHHMIASIEDDVTGIATESIESKHTHGAGCVLSAVIAGKLALTIRDEVSADLFDRAFRFAMTEVHHAIRFAPQLGQGVGPVETRVVNSDGQSII